MPRSPRYFESNKPYIITFRARRGLPIVATYYMHLLLTGILARVQRDNKVTICHYLWMGNHLHIIVMIHDAEQAQRFYSEVQKKVTDTIKALLGLDHLCLWEGRPVVAQIGDSESLINQIIYLYANPARAALVNSITEYPGCSSWDLYRSAPHLLKASVHHKTRWIPASALPLLPNRSMRKQADTEFTEKLLTLGISYTLELQPNACMKSFGITDEELQSINELILTRLSAREKEYKEDRLLKKLSVMGERALRTQPILADYTPKRTSSDRHVFYISSDKEDRISFINHFKELCAVARQCYFDALKNLSVCWPPGMFRPPMRQVAAALEF